jgi:ubiquinone/menaquinone biosynthesis C-methylase UbiE
VAELQALREALHELQSEHEALKESARPQPVTVAPCVPTLQPPRELSDEVRDEREAFADSLPVPGRDAPVFNLVNDCLAIGATPWADPLVPAYLLDNNYRIVDWNLAFGLAFDRTMDGRRGQSILEWVYFLDNYDEVLERAVSAFGEGTVLPRIHIEDIAYTSERFGKVLATKRAYQVPGDQDETLGWLVTLEVRFVDAATTRRYKHELFELLRRDLTWSDYALSYDRVLKASPVYLELLDHVLGEKVPPRKGSGSIEPLKRGSRIIDLGSGTGNIPVALAQQNRGHVIFAVENNRLMLDLLRDKCRPYLRADDEGPGILAIKQDVNTLFGLQDNSFDYAILNNVAYALDDPLPCLRHVRRVLKADGEIRVSGPQKTTDLNRLFSRIAGDLKASGRMKDLQEDYDRVAAINRNVLSSRLYRWSVDDMQQMLRDAGFGQITYVTDTAYGGQSMIVCARKQRVNGGRPSSRSG